MRKSAPLFCALLLSLSARRAWIEMCMYVHNLAHEFVALRKESVDRNIVEIHPDGRMTWSLSARRAWIEIAGLGVLDIWALVALRKESVDRNCRARLCPICQWVALRKESVDRNGLVDLIHIHALVALRKESVDRNGYKCSII